MQNRFVIIDGNAILHRAWHAMPPLQTKDGRIVNAAYGFTVMLMKVLKDLKPTHLAVTFDLPGETFRHQEFAAYKAQRMEKPQELYDQIPMIKDILSGFHIPVFEKEGFEADDVIGTLSKKAGKGTETIIVTGDLDTLQLVDPHTKVYTLRKGMSDVVVYDEAAVKERYGLTPGQLIDYKAMRGDVSDNLPGLKGIGEVGAGGLLRKYGTIEGVYRAVKKNPNDFKPGILKALTDGEKDVPLSKRLVTIVRDLPLKFDLKAVKVKMPDLAALRGIFQDLEFRTLLPKVERELGGGEAAEPKAKPAKQPGGEKLKTAPAGTADIFRGEEGNKFLKKFSKSGRAGFRLLYANDDRLHPKFAALAISDGRRSAALLFENGELPAAARKFLSDGSIVKVGHDVKDDMTALASVGAQFAGTVDDCMIMSYLLNPGSRAHKLSDLVFELTGRASMSQDTLFAEDRARAACAEAEALLKIGDSLETKLKEEKLDELYASIERPLIPVLSSMERHGIKVAVPFLTTMADRMRKRIDELTEAITKDAGEPFNINSPAQLQRILFEVLKLPTKGIKKTGTGQLSTGADELEKLQSAHPIIKHIFEHREYSKLLSTYVAAIPQLVRPDDGRLHTHFNQSVTATGRLSSSEPNLQNIPIRTELGREIRKAFVAEKSCLLISADYSQIELRIAASLANDKNMIGAFRRGDDIHTITAAKIWDVPPEKVSFEQRRAAKAINFGILYGMGPNALAASAGVSREEARKFIDKYLNVYSGLKAYMDEAKAQAKSLGYVETLFGRRRYLPEIHSGVPFIRAEAERMAVNMPIQGTNADIIKLAMIRLHERIKKEFGLERDAKLKMLLQVHDELVFEAAESIVKEVTPWIIKTMETVVELKVPVDVKVKIGKNWGELEAH